MQKEPFFESTAVRVAMIFGGILGGVVAVVLLVNYGASVSLRREKLMLDAGYTQCMTATRHYGHWDRPENCLK